MKKRMARRGQATVEFAVVISVFMLLLFGVIEVARAIYEKQNLARAAESITQVLSEVDPRSTSSLSPDAAAVATAITGANRQANLNLPTGYPYNFSQNSNTTSLYFNSASNSCTATGAGAACESATNSDSSVTIVGFPDLTTPTKLKVTVKQAYRSFLEYPLQFLTGNASETVQATTLYGQLN